MKKETKKKFWLSRTFWLNIVAIVAMIIQAQLGWVMPPETQTTALALINMVLRLVTRSEIGW
jgi:hypothetical protein